MFFSSKAFPRRVLDEPSWTASGARPSSRILFPPHTVPNYYYRPAGLFPSSDKLFLIYASTWLIRKVYSASDESLRRICGMILSSTTRSGIPSRRRLDYPLLANVLTLIRTPRMHELTNSPATQRAQHAPVADPPPHTCVHPRRSPGGTVCR